MMMKWCEDKIVQRSNGVILQWCSSAMVQWRDDVIVHGRNGSNGATV